MAAQPPPLDPSSTTLTLDQVFLHPLPQIRQFHRQLTTQLDEKNARLRTLVGGSYRDLLGTAELILQMRNEIEEVEDKLGRVGERCGREGVGKGGRGLRRLIDSEGDAGREGRRKELQWSARLKGLSSCALVIGRLLRKGANSGDSGQSTGRNLVLAAKVLVLSRLLAKSLSDLTATRDQSDKEYAEELKKKLGILRRKLLRGVERTLQKVGKQDDNREDIIQALTAYALATSSGSKDVLRHFLHVRGEAIGLAFEDEEDQKKQTPGVLRALELYTATLLDVQSLVPRRLSEALSGLKTRALLKDDSVRQLEALRLDVCEKWFGDEILYFTPYIRHDDLDGPQAVDTLKGWSKRASEVLLQGLGQALEGTGDFKTVVEMRTKILEIWIKEGGKAKGFDPSIMLDGIRKVVNDRMVELVETRISKLHLLGTEIQATLGSWQPGVTDKYDSLWDESMLELEISNGAGLFKQGILSRTHGRNDAVHRVFSSYQTWRRLVDEVITIIEQLKKQRWDDDLEDIEDDLTLESRNALLTQDDPAMLQEHLDSSLERNYKDLHEKIASLLKTYQKDDHIGAMSIYIIRIIRDIRAGLPQNPSLQSFGASLIPSLHQQLASTVSIDPVDALIASLSSKKVPARALWEGDPALPIQTTPATFKFLRALSQRMASVGSDLWSPAAVDVLKRHLQATLTKRWTEHINLLRDASSKSNGAPESSPASTSPPTAATAATETDEIAQPTTDPEPDPTPKEPPPSSSATVSKDLLNQHLFDILVLSHALSHTSPAAETDPSSTLTTLSKRLEEDEVDITELDASSKKRMHVAAREFWRRTSLLFGLLV